MKKLILLLICVATFAANAQDFDKNLATARSSYSAGDLENARFATEQLLRDLDIAIGKEILKLLPTTVATLKANEKDDNLTGGAGYAGGLYVQRYYGAAPKVASIDIINNSPLINSIQSILTMPVLGGMMRDENQKQIKVQGYKSLLNRTVDSETGKTNYELQIPMNNTLLTLKIDDTNEGEITQAANALPLAKIVQLAQ
ncbi:MAG: hypothetical protein ACOYW3_03105 [Bacteroidota bacterium]